MKSRDSWRHLGAMRPAALSEATRELHHAVQFVAAAGQTFAEARSDDSHRAMSWSHDLRAFVGAPLAGPYPFRVSVRPDDLALQILDRTDEALGTLPLSGRTVEDGFSWLSKGFATYMGGSLPVIQRPEYEIPPHPLGEGARFSGGNEAERKALAALYDAAGGLLADYRASVADTSDVLCWPHHFDIAALTTVARDPSGELAKSVGVGMAPMGGGVDGWYWYVTPWPYPDPSVLPELDGPGHWHTEGWVGAVLDGDTVVAADPEFRSALVHKFVDVAVACARIALSV